MASKRKEPVAVMVGLFENLINLVFPMHCRLCRRKSDEPVCLKCRNSFNFIEPPLCAICGFPIGKGKSGLCTQCSNEKPPFRLCRSVYYYDEKLRKSIRLLKYGGKYEIASVLFNLGCDYFMENEFLFPVDCIVPVPSNKKRIKERNINHSLVFGRMLAERTGIPLKHCLERVRDTDPQYMLDFRSRRDNVRGAFITADENEIKDRNILLADDIITTGATAEECCKALLDGGAASVYVFTLARSIGGKPDEKSS
jgi:ComF family protein